MGWQPVGPTSSNGDGHTSFGSPHSLSLHLQPGHRGTRDNIYGYLAKRARIEGSAVDVFTDSGASFNAISPVIASRLALTIKESDKPLKIKLGVKRHISIPRRTAEIVLDMDGFPPYSTEVFVMDVPEDKHVLLGVPWLVKINPDIDGSPNQSVHGGRHH
ncbi:Aspartyl protease [Phytophthora infestans]|uniref:Aspartyl protease n=1 Tax=Phytophthora infestans TaxID=4787 RepID=A0A8S9V8D9_PHYIN|nr:Aspartyl protease [Phytophthora infestans]